MKACFLILLTIAVLAVPAGCAPPATIVEPGATSSPPTATQQPPTARPTIAPTIALTASHTPNPPTQTFTPTLPSIPPTFTPLPPTTTPLPASAFVCAADCDFASIQAAIDDPDTNKGAIIEIQDPLHTEAGIVVNKDVTIRGLGVDLTIVQAAESAEAAPERVFLIVEGVTAVFNKMTIQHGQPSDQKECGGGIMNHGTLTLDQVVVRDNISNSGGGICNSGALALFTSTVRDNIANGVGPTGFTCGAGGGIKCERGTLTLTNSTISGNKSEDADPFRDVGNGGGVHVGCKCNALFVNSTISGNRSVAHAGGIYDHGNLKLINCTITDNHTVGEGGGIYVRGYLDFSNTIIADNSGKGGSCFVGGPGGYYGEGSIGINTNNLVRGGNCEATFSDPPLLGPLADNGGATLTHALLPGSPAIDAISPISCTLTTDQRGLPRPVVQTSADTPCDIGAFEVQPE